MISQWYIYETIEIVKGKLENLVGVKRGYVWRKIIRKWCISISQKVQYRGKEASLSMVDWRSITNKGFEFLRLGFQSVAKLYRIMVFNKFWLCMKWVGLGEACVIDVMLCNKIMVLKTVLFPWLHMNWNECVIFEGN